MVQAGSADEAVQRVHAGLRPDVLLTGHLMPGKSGTELAHELRTIVPELPVLISGYAEVGDPAPDLPRLTKPFRNLIRQPAWSNCCRAEMACSRCIAGVPARPSVTPARRRLPGRP